MRFIIRWACPCAFWASETWAATLPMHAAGGTQAVPSWFVRVTAFKQALLAANAETHWVPRAVKVGVLKHRVYAGAARSKTDPQLYDARSALQVPSCTLDALLKYEIMGSNCSLLHSVLNQSSLAREIILGSCCLK